MAVNKLGGVLSPEQLKQFHEDGYLVVRQLFRTEEIEKIKEIFMQIHAGGPVPGHFHPVPLEAAGGDILKAYPRIMHPHRFNEDAKNYMIDSRVMNILADLFNEEPLAAQSMFYFKPPGAKGQALHQDNFYLKIEPGTCIAAWTAVDDADEENGGLMVVPQTNHEEIQCPHTADPEQSFTRDEVDVPSGKSPVIVNMKAGDVLFFNGSLIHGSYPNRSKDRFRRAFICHYTGISTTRIAKYYKPLVAADGRIIDDIEVNTDGGPCGTEFQVSGPH